MTTSSASRTTIDLDGSWSIGDKIHGGYLLSEVVRAALTGGEYPHPLGVSAHFASAPDPGSADLDVEPLRAGRRVGLQRARLSQGDAVRAEVLITAGTLPVGATPLHVEAQPPAMPPPQECPPATGEAPGGVRVGPAFHLDMRFDPSTVQWLDDEPSGRGVIRSWVRRPDGQALDPYWLLIAGDALPPVTLDLGIRGWVPTVTMDVHIRSLPAAGWILAEQTSQLVAGGWLDEKCQLWDSGGRLVASVRQLAGYRER